MLHFTRQQLLQARGQHLASTPHLRLQVLAITQEAPAPLFAREHGDVLLAVLSGSCVLVLDEAKQPLQPGDQVLVEDGEPLCSTANPRMPLFNSCGSRDPILASLADSGQ